jgi:hypothetical protein
MNESVDLNLQLQESIENAIIEQTTIENTKKIESKNEYSWTIVDIFESVNDLNDFISNNSYRMIISHGKQISKCNLHLNINKHNQKYCYYRCASYKCHSLTDKRQCGFIYRSNNCLEDNKIRVFKTGSHIDKNSENDDVNEKKRGITLFFKSEIDNLLKENDIYPFAILKILTLRKTSGLYKPNTQLPSLDQIRGYKKRNNINKARIDEEYDKVNKLCLDLTVNSDVDEKKPFVYGLKMGSGSDDDPLIICFSSKHLLKRISNYPNHFAIFHIDGTYRLIKNRFPIIAYGRSDTNGQFHLISLAICSVENTQTYTHFYR